MSLVLGLLRHAKSSWEDPGLADFDRPLSRRGRKAAVLLGSELKRLGIAFDLVIASPAKRVTETMELFAEGYGSKLDVRFDPRIYEASLPAVLDVIREVGKDKGHLLLVGHNPTFARLAIYVSRTGDPLYLKVADHFPTGAFLLAELPVESWAEIAPGGARVLHYLKPRELKAASSGD